MTDHPPGHLPPADMRLMCIEEAHRRHHSISLIKPVLEDNFQYLAGTLQFWFNDFYNSSHMVTLDLRSRKFL
jgi:hypothetical protein